MIALDGERQRQHWNSVAQDWSRIGAPLRPTEPDLRIIREAVESHCRRHPGRSMQALLFGVTEEIATMEWPAAVELLAVDRSAEMVRHAWPGDIPDRRRAACADWLSIVSQSRSLDVVVGDGCFNNMRFPEHYSEMLGKIHQALRADGIMVQRFFTESEERQSPATVLDAMWHGAFGNFHIFKFRLAMALQSEPGSGVNLADIWRTWSEAKISETRLQARTGWPLDTIRTIQLYRDSPGYFSFPTHRQIVAQCSRLFQIEAVIEPAYEMGDRCPTIVMRPRVA